MKDDSVYCSFSVLGFWAAFFSGMPSCPRSPALLVLSVGASGDTVNLISSSFFEMALDACSIACL